MARDQKGIKKEFDIEIAPIAPIPKEVRDICAQIDMAEKALKRALPKYFQGMNGIHNDIIKKVEKLFELEKKGKAQNYEPLIKEHMLKKGIPKDAIGKLIGKYKKDFESQVGTHIMDVHVYRDMLEKAAKKLNKAK